MGTQGSARRGARPDNRVLSNQSHVMRSQTGRLRQVSFATDLPPRGARAMENDDITRRDFVTMTVAAGIAAATGADLIAQQQVMEMNVNIKTADGTCDAAFIHP